MVWEEYGCDRWCLRHLMQVSLSLAELRGAYIVGCYSKNAWWNDGFNSVPMPDSSGVDVSADISISTPLPAVDITHMPFFAKSIHIFVSSTLC